MLKLSVFLFSLILCCMFVSCEKAEAEKPEIKVQVASEKACVPDAGCAGCPEAYAKVVTTPPLEIADVLKYSPKVIFIELGSVKCIPCRKMQPVMESVKQKYGKQIQVIFYDVWKADQRKYAETYDIRMIPTQVFLDSEGKEIMRHEGFFPEDQIETFLLEQGLEAQHIATR